MQFAYVSLILFALAFALIYNVSLKPYSNSELIAKKKKSPLIFTMLLLALLIRLVIAVTISGFPTDINCFKHWSDSVYNDGMSNFYFSDSFSDYPPGYMYILYIIGFLKNIFNLPFDSTAFLLMIKTPAIICDIIGAYLIYFFANKNEKTASVALSLSTLYALNPATIINSAAWGQVDSVYTLFIVLFICLLYSDKFILSCAVFTLGFMVKPQGIIFAPIIIFYFIYKLVFCNDTAKILKETGIAAVLCAAIIFLVALPFAKDFNFSPIIKQYISTIASYPYATVNAYNFNFIAGGNWADIKTNFLFLDFGSWSTIFITLTVFVAFVAFFKSEGKKSYFELAAFIIISVFTLAAKMHERYVFPAMILLIFSFIKKQDMRYIKLYFSICVTQFLNTAIVLYRSIALDTTGHANTPLVYAIAAANIGILIYMLWILFAEKKSGIIKEATASENFRKPKSAYTIKKSSPKKAFNRLDYIIMAVVTLVYGAVAFINLGNTKAAKTHLLLPQDSVLTFNLSEEAQSVKYYTGYTESRTIYLYFDGNYSKTINTGDVFAWHEEPIGKTSSAEFHFANDCDIIELAFFNKDGNYIPYTATGTSGQTGEAIDLSSLNDERSLIPKNISYKNSTYFDEIYHARTAYEYLNGLTPYENTHPPLGKVFISIGVAIFGMCPFGWRFAGTLFGILMLPLIYIFARELFKKRRVAVLAICLFALDFMHFAQTRIATIDVFVTFFVILMFYFMYRYTKLSFYDTPLIKTFIPLGLSGISFGLAVASKWTGLYGGVGLCILFFLSIGKRIYEYYKINAEKSSSREDIEKVKKMKSNELLTHLFCVGMFVVVPVLIYIASYIPYMKAPEMDGIKSIIDNQISMFNYHSKLTSTHPFSSQWYEWPFVIRPIWYYLNNISDTYKQTIASFGNPLIWWVGIIAFVYAVANLFKAKKMHQKSFFILIAFLSGYLPWIGVPRCIFIYHFFPCVPFLVLLICYMYDNMNKKSADQYEICKIAFSNTDILFLIFTILCLVLFMLFYPAISALTVPAKYIDSLRWFTTWTF